MDDGKTQPESPSTTSPPRQLGSEELKAFTHPLRMSMYMTLSHGGPATASQLARRLGQSSGDTSYHLRQLERFGLVEDDPEHQGGRERWWRAVGIRLEDPELFRDPVASVAARALVQRDIADRAAILLRWADAVFAGEIDVEGACALDTATVEMTDEEAAELIAAVEATLREHTARARARRASGDTEGRQRTRIYFDVLPLLPEFFGG